MLSSAILDVVVGLVFTFLAVSLGASAAVEAGASLFRLRSTTLKKGVMDLLNDPDFNGLAARLYGHALVNPRGPGLPPDAAQPAGSKALPAPVLSALTTRLPAYIQPRQFADALMETLSMVPTVAGAVPSAQELIVAIDSAAPPGTNPQLNQLLRGVVLRTQGDLAGIRKELCSWFDGAMDRVSGAYKKYTQLLTFVAALVISVTTNADSFQVAGRVWAQPTLVSELKAGSTAAATLLQAQSLPFGWPDGAFFAFRKSATENAVLSGKPLVAAIAGWFLTALASLFGAPFWFDTLQRVVRLKGTGPSPDEKQDDTAAAA